MQCNTAYWVQEASIFLKVLGVCFHSQNENGDGMENRKVQFWVMSLSPKRFDMCSLLACLIFIWSFVMKAILSTFFPPFISERKIHFKEYNTNTIKIVKQYFEFTCALLSCDNFKLWAISAYLSFQRSHHFSVEAVHCESLSDKSLSYEILSEVHGCRVSVLSYYELGWMCWSSIFML